MKRCELVFRDYNARVFLPQPQPSGAKTFSCRFGIDMENQITIRLFLPESLRMLPDNINELASKITHLLWVSESVCLAVRVVVIVVLKMAACR